MDDWNPLDAEAFARRYAEELQAREGGWASDAASSGGLSRSPRPAHQGHSEFEELYEMNMHRPQASSSSMAPRRSPPPGFNTRAEDETHIPPSSVQPSLVDFLNRAGEITTEAAHILRAALPHGGDAIGKLVQRQARERPRSASDRMLRMRYGTPKSLVGDRFGAFMRMVESDVKKVAERSGLPMKDAAELMRLGLSQAGLDKKLGNANKAQMLFALYGIREKFAAEPPLAAAMARHPAFRQLPIHEAWRMALDGEAWGDGKHDGLRFENEPGYMGGMFRGLTAMIQADLAGQRLDGDLLRELHDQCTTGVFGQSTLREGIQELQGAEEIEHLTCLPAVEQDPHGGLPNAVKLIAQDFRDSDRTTGFDLIREVNMSEAGFQEMMATYDHYDRDAAFRLFVKPPDENTVAQPPDAQRPAFDQGTIKLKTRVNTRDHVAARADEIIARHSEHIANAAPGDAKLQSIARLCQELERSHLFVDGNARTVGFLVLNKLLLENGMSPAMFEEPNHFDGYSSDELVDEIKRGQELFARYERGFY